MRKVVMVFEVDDLKQESEFKRQVMHIAQIMKAKLKKAKSESLNKKDRKWNMQYC